MEWVFFETIENTEVYTAAARLFDEVSRLSSRVGTELYEEAIKHSKEANKVILKKVEVLSNIDLIETFNTSAKQKIGTLTNRALDISKQITGLTYQV